MEVSKGIYINVLYFLKNPEMLAHGLQLNRVNRRIFDCKPKSRNLETPHERVSNLLAPGVIKWTV